ncbi:MAG: hypothetical protein IPJ84_19325 [Bdellovibrionales bacterium]|nr:hypothetical protein [Bdellovibrionales bacterium]
MRKLSLLPTLIVTLFSIQPSLADQGRTEYPQQLKSMGTVELGVELSKNLVASGWYCGSDYAGKVYDHLLSGGTLDTLQFETKSADCRNALIKMSSAIAETNSRVDQKAKQAGLKRREYQYSQFSFTAQVKTDQPATEVGNAECLELGRPLLKKFYDNPTYPPFGAFGEQSGVASDRCEIAREVGGSDHLLTCSNWLIASEFDSENGVALLPSMTQHVYRKAELKQMEDSRAVFKKEAKSKSPSLDMNPERLKMQLDYLNLTVNGGFQYQAVLTIDLANKTSKMELIGEIPKLRQAQQNGRVYTKDSPTSCRFTSPMDANISEVTSGGIFFNRRID